MCTAVTIPGTDGHVRRNAQVSPDQLTLTINGRRIPVMPDGIGSYVTHVMVWRWRDIEELATSILRWHPDYSPSARRRES